VATIRLISTHAGIWVQEAVETTETADVEQIWNTQDSHSQIKCCPWLSGENLQNVPCSLRSGSRVPRRARIQGPSTLVLLNPGLESTKEEKGVEGFGHARDLDAVGFWLRV
jgi:hypothetical protein